MPAGRPTSYDPAYCDQVIEWGKLGKSKAWMAAEMGVARNTIDNWADANPEFLSAFTLAMDLSQQWWEDAGQKGMIENTISAPIWSRSMAARFPADWREVKGTELSGKDGDPIKSEVVGKLDMTGLSTEALRELSKLQLK